MIKANTQFYPQYIGINRLPKKEFVFFKQRILNAVKRGDISTKPVVNKHTGFEIYLGNIKHGINHRGTVLKTKSFTVIREVIKYALLFNVATDKQVPQNNVYYFVYVMLIDGHPYEVRITVKKQPIGRYYYHHDLLSIKPYKKINPAKLT